MEHTCLHKNKEKYIFLNPKRAEERSTYRERIYSLGNRIQLKLIKLREKSLGWWLFTSNSNKTHDLKLCWTVSTVRNQGQIKVFLLCFLYLGVVVHRETCVSERWTAVNFVICSTYISLLWTDYVFSFLSIWLMNDQSDCRKGDCPSQHSSCLV